MSKRAKYGVAALVALTGIVVGVIAIREGVSVGTLVSVLTHDQMAGPAVLQADANDLQATVVTPHLECEVAGDKNVLWCATFQIAWNELCDLLGEPIPSAGALEMVSLLNQHSVTGADLDETSYVALAGYPTGGTDDILARIAAAMEEKFGGAARPDLLPDRQSLGPGDWVAYAYLFKSLPFEWAFRRSRNSGMSFAGQNVQTFGINQLLSEEENEVRAARQVLVYDYRDENDFIVELKTRSEPDRLILAKVVPAATLEQTVRMVQARLGAAPPKAMVRRSNLRIPVLDFDIMKRYAGLLDRGWGLQQVRFKLDETGAILKSQGIGATARSQDLIFDRPFLVMLQRVGAANPYFALWVANAELLVSVE